MKKVLITGAKGNIGSILSKSLKDDYHLTLVDLPKTDVRNYKSLLRIFPGHEAVIHLAWNAKTENFQGGFDPDNALMFSNVYRAALEAGVQKVIMASSVHADNFYPFVGKKRTLLSAEKIPEPSSPYGANKVFMEALGRFYATQGLEVACIRFGAVGYGKPKDKLGKILWLSDDDCTSLIRKIIETKKIPGNFSVMYGVSNNKGRIHDFSNQFGWKPRDRI